MSTIPLVHILPLELYAHPKSMMALVVKKLWTFKHGKEDNLQNFSCLDNGGHYKRPPGDSQNLAQQNDTKAGL